MQSQPTDPGSVHIIERYAGYISSILNVLMVRYYRTTQVIESPGWKKVPLESAYPATYVPNMSLRNLSVKLSCPIGQLSQLE